MLDQTILPASSSSADWRDAVAIGDIIRWPLGGTPGLALVIEIETIGGWRVLSLAPGMADTGPGARPGTLRVSRLDEIRQSGLIAAIRFDLDQAISVAPSHPALQATGSPIVGRLCETALDRLHAERARIHALRDIAAHRRADRGRTVDRRTGWRHQPRPRFHTSEEGRA